MEESHGRITIDPDVLVTIARLTTLSVPGVTRTVAARPRDFLRRGAVEGVLIEVEDSYVQVELYIAVETGHNLRDIARAIQTEVARAIRNMVGLDIAGINVHIEEIDFPQPVAQ